MVDAAIVMIENAHKHLERLPPDHSGGARVEAMLAACKEVGPSLFFSLLIITVSFLPVFTLESQEGRLFSPLAYTKTSSMAGLLPILWSTGTGSEVMSRSAAPMVGGMVSSTVLTLCVIPALYALIKQWRLGKGWEGG